MRADAGTPASRPPTSPHGVRRLGTAARAALGLAVVAAVVLGGVRLRAVWLMRAAETAARAGRWEAVEAALDRRAWYGALDAEALRLRAEAAMRLGDRVAAARLLRAGAAETRSAELHERAGAMFLEASHLREAEAAFTAALRADARSERSLRALIVILGVERRAADQEQALWKLHDLGPGTALEALTLLAPGVPVIPPDSLPRDTDEAQLLRQAVEADPNDTDAAIALANLLGSRGQVDEARSVLDRPALVGDGPWQAAREAARARLLEEEGRRDELAALIGRTAGAEENPDWQRLLARFALEEGRAGAAVEAFRSLIRHDPRDPSLRYRLARALAGAGRDDDAAAAEADFRAAEEVRSLAGSLDEEHPDPATIQAIIERCSRLGRQREAAAWGRQAERASREQP